jgi:hypothetical protein
MATLPLIERRPPAEGKATVSLQVLVVEDEALVSHLIKEILTDLGCSVVGPVTSMPPRLLF